LEHPRTVFGIFKPQASVVESQSTVHCQVVAMHVNCEVLRTCVPTERQEWEVTDRRTETGEQYYDVEENIYSEKIRTVICEASYINPGNDQLS
jgi:hypothetical protein